MNRKKIIFFCNGSTDFTDEHHKDGVPAKNGVNDAKMEKCSSNEEGAAQGKTMGPKYGAVCSLDGATCCRV